MSVFMHRARVADLERIMVLERATFGVDAWSDEAMRRELESPHAYYLVAVDDEARARRGESDPDSEPEPAPVAGLLGYAGLLAPAGGGQGDIQTIAVAPPARGLGLGRGLMHALITEARRRHIAEIFLEVRADNPIARALYDSLGFEEIGVRRRYYRDGVDAVHMRLTVPPAVAMPAAGAPGTSHAGRESRGAADTETSR